MVIKTSFRVPTTSGHDKSAFAYHLKDLRRHFGGKQLWLANGVGCTEAAVSMWERGKRLPRGAAFRKIVAVLGEAGATSCDLDFLVGAWQRAKALEARESTNGDLPRGCTILAS